MAEILFDKNLELKIDGNAIEYYNPHKKTNKGTG